MVSYCNVTKIKMVLCIKLVACYFKLDYKGVRFRLIQVVMSKLMGDMVHFPKLSHGSTFTIGGFASHYTVVAVTCTYLFYLPFNFSCTVVHTLYIELWYAWVEQR